MVMKVKGVTYTVSPCKFIFPDTSFKQLDILRDAYRMNNGDIIIHLINEAYHYLQAKQTQKESSVPQESENKDVK